MAPIPSTNDEQDGRIEDYLNDKVQTNDDLNSLDSLVANVVKQQTLLFEQVRILHSMLLPSLTGKLVASRREESSCPNLTSISRQRGISVTKYSAIQKRTSRY